MKSLYPAL